jgi:hypothetical protein
MYQTKNYKEVLSRTIVKDFPINYDVLYSIMYKQSPTYDTGSQQRKAKFLLDLFRNYAGVEGSLDKMDNLYFVKGKAEFYPTIVAHYDTAQDYHPGLTIQQAGGWIYGFDTTTGAQCGIGADDSVGIYFALEMMKMMPACKVVLFYGEERGCIGSSSCDMLFFRDSLLVSQLDRRSFKNDFIVHTNGLTVFPDEHIEVIEDILTKYDYLEANGSCTDVGALRKSKLEVASHNTACGYFNEHTDEEIIHIPSMINAMAMVHDIQSRLFEKQLQLTFPYVATPEKTWGYGKSITYYEDSLDQNYYDWYKIQPDDEVRPQMEEILEIAASEWSYFKQELTDEYILELTGVSREDATEENCLLNPVFYGLPYVMYHKKSFSSIRGEFMDISKEDIKHYLINQEENNKIGIHSCCTSEMVYDVDHDYMYCPECESQYYYPFEPEDLIELPDDSTKSLDRTVKYFI